ncbi:uncharacterized protein LOC110081954 isoform X3 [Pogona vitticeps]
MDQPQDKGRGPSPPARRSREATATFRKGASCSRPASGKAKRWEPPARGPFLWGLLRPSGSQRLPTAAKRRQSQRLTPTPCGTWPALGPPVLGHRNPSGPPPVPPQQAPPPRAPPPPRSLDAPGHRSQGDPVHALEPGRCLPVPLLLLPRKPQREGRQDGGKGDCGAKGGGKAPSDWYTPTPPTEHQPRQAPLAVSGSPRRSWQRPPPWPAGGTVSLSGPVGSLQAWALALPLGRRVGDPPASVLTPGGGICPSTGGAAAAGTGTACGERSLGLLAGGLSRTGGERADIEIEGLVRREQEQLAASQPFSSSQGDADQAQLHPATSWPRPEGSPALASEQRWTFPGEETGGSCCREGQRRAFSAAWQPAFPWNGGSLGARRQTRPAENALELPDPESQPSFTDTLWAASLLCEFSSGSRP